MAVYKFRVAYEDDDNIFRDIEIKPSHTFRDLDECIAQSYNFPKDKKSRLYKSNDRWLKLDEINIDEKPVKKKKEIHQPMIIHYIDDPHQHFLYEFESKKQTFNLLIELLSLNGNEKAGVDYPMMVRSSGPSPVKKDDLMAHLSKKEAVDDDEQYAVDEEDDDVEGMGKEGDEEGEEEGGDDADTSEFDEFNIEGEEFDR